MQEKEMNEVEKMALWYLETMKWSVIPVGANKKPLIQWEQFQKRHATREEIHKWFGEDGANIGIITGAISGIACIDIDDPELQNATLKAIEDFVSPPTCLTPRGGRHLYFQYRNGIRNATSIFPKVDIRGEGGYVLAPPSRNGNGKQYTWLRHPSKFKMTSFPVNIEATTPVPKQTKAIPMFKEGRRDDDLFHFANAMIKGGAKIDEVRTALAVLAQSCDPPFPKEELDAKIESALKRTDKRERNITEQVRHWVQMQDGYFDIHVMYKDLEITKNEKQACHTAMSRLVKEGVVERFGKKAGTYRTKSVDIEEMHWEEAPTRDMDVRYPLNIEELAVTYPSNIIVIAGASNSGKTTFLLDFTRLNCQKHEIHYFNSEMGDTELKMRLKLFENASLNDWRRVKFYERGDNFDDVIRPDKINVIDYLEVLTDFWKVGEQIKSIHSKLTTGIAIIAIQKNRGSDLGRGGAFGTEKPRLYLSMDYGKIKIVKAKNWRTTDNPNNLSMQFKIAGGWKFIPTEWKAEEK